MKFFSWYRRKCLRMHLLLMPVIPLFSNHLFAQTDTAVISLPDAEKMFLQNNLSLLAAKYNVDANRALIRQAKLWDNPVLSTDQNIYDAQGKFFSHNNTSGQVYVQVTQLIKTAGKRNKLARLAEDNTTRSQQQFDDLLRTLRYTLVSDMLEVWNQLKQKNVYEGEILQLQKLVTGMAQQLASGNISVKDNMRIRALMFSLQNEVVNIEAQAMPLQSEIKLLLRRTDSSFIKPGFNYYLPDLINGVLPEKSTVLDSALANRPDARIAQTLRAYQNDNLVYQKALAKPDISIGSEYDQRSSYAPNYVGLAISLPLNFFNKNQGNIASAKFNVQQQNVLADGQTAKIASEITEAYDKIKFYQQVNNLQQLDFSRQYDTLFQNMLNSYQQRQVSLLEFIDFTDAYKDTKLKLLDQHSNLVKSIAELNYLAGKDIIPLNK